MGHIPNIDEKEFEQISNSLLVLYSNAEGDILKRLIDQATKMNDLLRRMYALMSMGEQAPTLMSVPDASTVRNPDEFSGTLDTFRSHLASHDKHLVAHDGHLAILGERIDLLVERMKDQP